MQTFLYGVFRKDLLHVPWGEGVGLGVDPFSPFQVNAHPSAWFL